MNELLPLVEAASLPATALRDAFNAAFADYLIGPPRLDDAGWAAFVHRQGADLGCSRTVVDGDRVMAFALVGRLPGGRRRLATMGARPEARGSGAAPRLLDRVLDEARAAGAPGMELEVFAQNSRAVQLYRGRGFEAVCELHGWLAAPSLALSADETAPDVTPVTRAAAAEALDGLDLPYQVSGAAVRASALPLQAWRRGAAQLVFHVAGGEVAVASFVDRGDGVASDDARALLRALRVRHAGLAVRVPQLQRPEFGAAALQAEGFGRAPQHQLLMHRALP